MSTFAELTKQILAFRDERNWKQFHGLRNLAAAIAIESGELQELMLWKTDNEVQKIVTSREGKQKLSAEIADILIVSLLSCDATGIDPEGAIGHKLILNAERFPASLARNNVNERTTLRPD